MYKRYIGRSITIYLILSWALAACQVREGGPKSPKVSEPSATITAAVLPASAIERTPIIPFPTAEPPYPGPAEVQQENPPVVTSVPYPGPPTERPDIPPRTPLPTQTIAPTRTPKPTRTPTPTATVTEIPADYLLPSYNMERFQPPALPGAALWTADHRNLTVHTPTKITFPLVPASWKISDTSARFTQLTKDGSKLAYLVPHFPGSGDLKEGHLVIIDDLAAGERHIYHFPYIAGEEFNIPNLHFSPGESNLLFMVSRLFSWTWMVVNLDDWSIQPLSLSLDPLGDPGLLEISGKPAGLQPYHSTRSSLYPIEWTPAGILSRKVIIASDALPYGIYITNPHTGGVILVKEYSGWGPRASRDGALMAFTTMSGYSMDIAPGDPFSSQAYLFNLSNRTTTNLFTFEDRLISIHGWTTDGRSLIYTLMSPNGWKTEALGLYAPNTRNHRIIEFSGSPDLDSVVAGAMALDEDRLLVRAYSNETHLTSLYTLPIDEFSSENLVFIQSFNFRPYILHIPDNWPD